MEIITQASPVHYNDIVRIYNQAVLEGSQTGDEEIVSLNDKLHWLKQHTGDHYIIYVANIEDEVVGYLALSPYRFGRSLFTQTAEISYYIDTDHQGKGIGTKLISHAISQCPELNISSLIAIVLSCNTSSIALLNNFKFEKWGCMPNIAKMKSGVADHVYYGIHLE